MFCIPLFRNSSLKNNQAISKKIDLIIKFKGQSVDIKSTFTIEIKMITEEELITTLAELKGQPHEIVKCLFQYFPTEKEYTLNGYIRLLEDILLVEEIKDPQ